MKVVDTSSLTGFSKGDETMAMALSWFNDYFIAQKKYALSNAIDTVTKAFGKKLDGPCPSPECDSVKKNKFRSVLLEERADLIVTVYHMDLLAVLEVAIDLGNLPVLHLATDIDIKMHEVFLNRLPRYDRFRVGVRTRMNNNE